MKKNRDRNTQWILASLFSLFIVFSNTCLAFPFSIIPKPGTSLPTTVNIGNTTSAFYMVSNSTTSTRYNNYVKWLPPHVTQITGGDNCDLSFTLAGKGESGDSCILELEVSGPVNGNDPNPNNHLFVCFPGGITCAGTNFPLNVTQTLEKTLSSISITPTIASKNLGETQQYTAIGQYSDNSTSDITTSVLWSTSSNVYASITTNGLATALCSPSAFITASLNSITSNSATLIIGSGLTYITNTNNDLYACNVNKANGFLTGCTLLHHPLSVSNNAALNQTSTELALVPPIRQNILANCLIGGLPLGHFIKNEGGVFNLNSQINLNPAGTLAYLINNDSNLNNVSICSISKGALSQCFTTNGEGHFSAPSAVAINPATGAFAYIVNGSGTIVACDVDPIQGALVGCVNTHAGALSHSTKIAIHPQGTYAYIANQSGTIDICTVDGKRLTKCLTSALGSMLSTPIAVTVNPNGTFLYIADETHSNQVLVCPLTHSGRSMGTCKPTGDFNGFPAKIAAI